MIWTIKKKKRQQTESPEQGGDVRHGRLKKEKKKKDPRSFFMFPNSENYFMLNTGRIGQGNGQARLPLCTCQGPRCGPHDTSKTNCCWGEEPKEQTTHTATTMRPGLETPGDIGWRHQVMRQRQSVPPTALDCISSALAPPAPCASPHQIWRDLTALLAPPLLRSPLRGQGWDVHHITFVREKRERSMDSAAPTALGKAGNGGGKGDLSKSSLPPCPCPTEQAEALCAPSSGLANTEDVHLNR